MSENAVVVTQVQAAAARASRLFFVDNLRTSVVILVILHHIAVIYSGNGSFYYIEAGDAAATALLSLLTALDQAWFMGALFLLSGYFTPGSLDRKGTGAFLRDRLVRLGIPLVFFFFVLNPVTTIFGLNATPSSVTHITAPLTWRDYPRLVGIGPLWFVEMLLVFDFSYAAWRWLAGKRSPRTTAGPGLPGFPVIAAFVLALAVASYVIRIPLPIGKAVAGFPTLAYLPQYLSFFCIGVLASRGDWARTIPGPAGKWGLVAALAATFTLFLVAIAGVEPGSSAPLLGDGSWQSAVYAVWDSIFAVGFFLALVVFFRRFLGHQGSFGGFLSRHSYTVYIIHAPILVFLALALRGVEAENLLKFAMLAVLAIPISFGMAFLVRKVPLASRVL